LLIFLKNPTTNNQQLTTNDETLPILVAHLNFLNPA